MTFGVPAFLSLEETVIALYCALDEALRKFGLGQVKGKLVPRRGPAPDVDDLQVVCLSLLQELLGFESDNRFHRWLAVDPVITSLFPRRINRQNFADRRVLLTPVLERQLGAFCDIAGEGRLPFSSSTRIRLTSAGHGMRRSIRRTASAAWRGRAGARR